MKKQAHQIRVSYAAAVYGDREKRALLRVFENPSRIAAGSAVREFEKKIARIFAKKFGVMVNSGSSANLLALELLDLPRGSEVITPALTFGTTVSPILKRGLVPLFVDVEPATYVVDVNRVERLITKKTKALMIPLLIGNAPDMARLRQIAAAHNLVFIEDSCDTLGSQFGGKSTGQYSDISTTSFYASHIITAAGGGGMLCINNPAWHRRARVLASWGRASTLFGAYERSEEIRKRFAGRLGGEPYDAKFLFTEQGYNFQPLEAQGAFGLAQLERLGEFQRKRRSNFENLKKFFAAYGEFFILPREHPDARVHWLAFPLTLRPGAPFSRFRITKYLEERTIQTRPIFTGNILRQPAFENIRSRSLVQGFPVTDFVMRNSFLIGCHHGLGERHLNYLKETFHKFLERYA